MNFIITVFGGNISVFNKKYHCIYLLFDSFCAHRTHSIIINISWQSPLCTLKRYFTRNVRFILATAQDCILSPFHIHYNIQMARRPISKRNQGDSQRDIARVELDDNARIASNNNWRGRR